MWASVTVCSESSLMVVLSTQKLLYETLRTGKFLKTRGPTWNINNLRSKAFQNLISSKDFIRCKISKGTLPCVIKLFASFNFDLAKDTSTFVKTLPVPRKTWCIGSIGQSQGKSKILLRGVEDLMPHLISPSRSAAQPQALKSLFSRSLKGFFSRKTASYNFAKNLLWNNEDMKSGRKIDSYIRHLPSPACLRQ